MNVRNLSTVSCDEAASLRIPTEMTKPNLRLASATGGEVSLCLPDGNGYAAADRDAVLRALHGERRSLIARKRQAALSERDAAYLSDIEREIDRLEMAEESNKSSEHPSWPKVEKLLERVLELQAKYGEGSRRTGP